jgi:tRNA (guanine37-N1)-methyltransferase
MTADIHVITIFPGMFAAISNYGVCGRAIEQGQVKLRLWNPRDYAEDQRRTVDDRPYGGGPGMVMTAPPLTAAIKSAKRECATETTVCYLSPQGRRLDHRSVRELAQRDALILLIGRYAGVDERVIANYVDEEWSIGDYVLSGGELAAMVLIDAIVRQLPDVLGNEASVAEDSFVNGLLDCGHYTRPEVFEGQRVPEVLLSGNHQAIQRWRLKQALGRTWIKRPDLLNELELTEEQKRLLQEFQLELEGDKR